MKATAIKVAAVLALVLFVSDVASRPYQHLPPKKGYVPVYIREGDTPLSEIHPKLAEAFHESEVESTMNTSNANEKLSEENTTTKIGINTEAANAQITE